MRGPVLVGRTDQLHRPGQHGTAGPTEDADLDHRCRQLQRETPQGRWRCPHGLRGRRRVLLEGRHVDLDPKLYVRLGEIPLRQQGIQLRGEVRGPRVVERVPVPALAQWGMEVVQYWHGMSSSGERSPVQVTRRPRSRTAPGLDLELSPSDGLGYDDPHAGPAIRNDGPSTPPAGAGPVPD